MNLPSEMSALPYPYPQPLPEQTKQRHLAATQDWQNRINEWNDFVLFPGSCLWSSLCSTATPSSSDPEAL